MMRGNHALLLLLQVFLQCNRNQLEAFHINVFSTPKVQLHASSIGYGDSIFGDKAESNAGTDSQTVETPSTSPSITSGNLKKTQHKDIIIIGGGLAGLSTALYISQIDPQRHVTILEKEDIKTQTTTVASFAAAGMLAPQSERLPKGPLLDLCISSRQCYRDFVDLVESLAAEAGEEGRQYLTYGDGKVHFTSAGGFLAPAFSGDTVATWSPPDESARWLDAAQVRELEPNLHSDVVGGWWFPEDASVDARRLTCALRAACIATGVEIKTGSEFGVKSLDLLNGECSGMYLESGKYVKAKAVLVANGSWMRELLPVPIEPHKGQSVALRMPPGAPPLLKRVLFAQDSYIVPKSDGRIIIGATVEPGSFNPDVTPAGMMHVLHFALQLVPALADLPIEESWVGLRPTTPDKGPILGRTPWNNLFLAGGYWRNGVLLAPKTGQLLAQLIVENDLSASDEALLEAFAWDRFTTEEGGRDMAMNARFAASMHPVQQRAEGSGVSAAVGTELGTHSTAKSAGAERAKYRQSLFGESDDSLEIAAKMGKDDALSFLPIEKLQKYSSQKHQDDVVGSGEPNDAINDGGNAENGDILEMLSGDSESFRKDPSADSLASSTSEDDSEFEDLSEIYEKIQQNKAEVAVSMKEAQVTERPDPGFRIHYEDPETKEIHEVPPYTSPESMLQIVAEKKAHNGKNTENAPNSDARVSLPTMNGSFSTGAEEEEQGYSDTLDGYAVIQDANSSDSRAEELESMKAARVKNRFMSDVDVSKIGVVKPEDL